MPHLSIFANVSTMRFLRDNRETPDETEARVAARLLRKVAESEYRRTFSDDDLFEEPTTNLETIIRKGR